MPDPSDSKISCSPCPQTLQVPNPAPPPGQSTIQAPSPETSSNRPPFPLLILIILVLVGAGVALWTYGMSPLAFVGALVGFLVGRALVGMIYPGQGLRVMPARFPNAHLSLALSMGGSALAISFWIFAFGARWFSAEGASLILLLFLPVTGVCWLIGGPTASTAARQALSQVQAGLRPETDLRLARIAHNLSRLMTYTLLGFLLWLLYLMLP